uniref:gibberellin-regulated protein 14 n=1 Tax=Fragaria vesca subsp. vesca TaxID=101020 RepID=UPI0005CAEE85|nr:PREDICTED: gibberellin-regulated protein 14 [Fragaria vesca subsp. vesca]
MSLYPNIHDEPEPSSSPLSQTITTPPGSPLPVTCARATPPAKSTPPTPIVKTSRDCVPLCGARCKVETNKKIWRRMCMKCCDLCKCVPPGHCGTNMDKCGKCYIDMEDHGHKCP